MAKNNLFVGSEEDTRSFLEKLTIAYAPMDDLVMFKARDTVREEGKKQAKGEAKSSTQGNDVRTNFTVRHLGSI